MDIDSLLGKIKSLLFGKKRYKSTGTAIKGISANSVEWDGRLSDYGNTRLKKILMVLLKKFQLLFPNNRSVKNVSKSYNFST